jgi:hypothetical protein
MIVTKNIALKYQEQEECSEHLEALRIITEEIEEKGKKTDG